MPAGEATKMIFFCQHKGFARTSKMKNRDSRNLVKKYLYKFKKHRINGANLILKDIKNKLMKVAYLNK